MNKNTYLPNKYNKSEYLFKKTYNSEYYLNILITN